MLLWRWGCETLDSQWANIHVWENVKVSGGSWRVSTFPRRHKQEVWVLNITCPDVSIYRDIYRTSWVKLVSLRARDQLHCKLFTPQTEHGPFSFKPDPFTWAQRCRAVFTLRSVGDNTHHDLRPSVTLKLHHLLSSAAHLHREDRLSQYLSCKYCHLNCHSNDICIQAECRSVSQ